MEKITLLTEQQVENLKILKKYSDISEPTDFYLTQFGEIEQDFYENKRAPYWTKTPLIYNDIYTYYYSFNKSISHEESVVPYGVRPVIKLSTINGKYKNIKDDIIEYGEYPQSVININLEEKIENLFQQNRLKTTGKVYTSMLLPEKRKYKEYLYKGSKYIRVNDPIFNNIVMYLDEDCSFKNGREINFFEGYWVKVEPIKWLVDKKENIAISKDILSCMPFSYSNDNSYKNSDIKEYLEKYFIKEIIPNTIKSEISNKNIDINKINDLLSLMDILNNEKPKIKKL